MHYLLSLLLLSRLLLPGDSTRIHQPEASALIGRWHVQQVRFGIRREALFFDADQPRASALPELAELTIRFERNGHLWLNTPMGPKKGSWQYDMAAQCLRLRLDNQNLLTHVRLSNHRLSFDSTDLLPFLNTGHYLLTQ